MNRISRPLRRHHPRRHHPRRHHPRRHHPRLDRPRLASIQSLQKQIPRRHTAEATAITIPTT
jgi:hypothetical protein